MAEEEATYSGDTRVVKALMYPMHVTQETPTGPAVVEINYKQGDEVDIEDMPEGELERGERLEAFYTDAELEAMEAGDEGGEGEASESPEEEEEE
jgi:hypothetical protein